MSKQKNSYSRNGQKEDLKHLIDLWVACRRKSGCFDTHASKTESFKNHVPGYSSVYCADLSLSLTCKKWTLFGSPWPFSFMLFYWLVWEFFMLGSLISGDYCSLWPGSGSHQIRGSASLHSYHSVCFCHPVRELTTLNPLLICMLLGSWVSRWNRITLASLKFA